MQDLKSELKPWILDDIEIKELQKQIRIIKKRQKNRSEFILKQMKKQNIDNIETKNGNILFQQRKVKSSISKKFLKETLSKFYQDNVENAELLSDFILNERKENIKESIVRK